jgi:hypothetical protein
MLTVPQSSNQCQPTFTGVRSLVKAVLIEMGLRLMGSPRIGPRLTRMVQRVVAALVRWGGLADA